MNNQEPFISRDAAIALGTLGVGLLGSMFSTAWQIKLLSALVVIGLCVYSIWNAPHTRDWPASRRLVLIDVAAVVLALLFAGPILESFRQANKPEDAFQVGFSFTDTQEYGGPEIEMGALFLNNGTRSAVVEDVRMLEITEYTLDNKKQALGPDSCVALADHINEKPQYLEAHDVIDLGREIVQNNPKELIVHYLPSPSRSLTSFTYAIFFSPKISVDGRKDDARAVTVAPDHNVDIGLAFDRTLLTKEIPVRSALCPIVKFIDAHGGENVYLCGGPGMKADRHGNVSYQTVDQTYIGPESLIPAHGGRNECTEIRRRVAE